MAFERLAACDFTVLISGESGTGKEVVARMIHRRSRRHAGPLIAVSGVALVDSLLKLSCSASRTGRRPGCVAGPAKLELAEGGTFFLDEVSGAS